MIRAPSNCDQPSRDKLSAQDISGLAHAQTPLRAGAAFVYVGPAIMGEPVRLIEPVRQVETVRRAW